MESLGVVVPEVNVKFYRIEDRPPSHEQKIEAIFLMYFSGLLPTNLLEYE